MDAVFKALADPTRRALLDRLYEKNGQTLNELCVGLGMSRQAVSQHLALLEAANLAVTVWHGREKLHYLNPAPLHEITERWLAKYERQRLEALSELKRVLENDVQENDVQENGVQENDVQENGVQENDVLQNERNNNDNEGDKGND